MSNRNIISFDNLSLQEFDTETDLIPLLTPEDEEEMNNEELPNSLPILPLRNTVLFPGVVIPISAGRDKSIKLINDANAGNKIIGVVAQKNEEDEDPTKNDIYTVGTVAQILRVLKMPDGNITVILQGKKRFAIDAVTTEKPYLKATIKEVEEKRPGKHDTEFQAIIDSTRELAIEIIKESPNIPSEATFAIKNIESQSFLINFVSSNMNLSVKEKQDLLMINVLKERALETLRFMNIEIQKLELKNDIQSKVRFDLDQQQREYFLHQQMKTIQEELGGVSNDQEIEEMRLKAKTKSWDAKTAKHFEKEISKMQRMNPQAPDFGIQRNYLELFLELPWNHYSKDIFDLKRAQKINPDSFIVIVGCYAQLKPEEIAALSVEDAPLKNEVILGNSIFDGTKKNEVDAIFLSSKPGAFEVTPKESDDHFFSNSSAYSAPPRPSTPVYD
jgi:ATP-dependent Lon protease